MPDRLGPGIIAEDSIRRAALFQARHADQSKIVAPFSIFGSALARTRQKLVLTALLQISQERTDALQRPLRTLEIQSGCGVFTCALARQGSRSLGADSRSDFIRSARLFAQEETQNGIFACLDFQSDATFFTECEQNLGAKPDIVLVSELLSHLSEPASFLEKLKGWLPSGALLLVHERNPLSPEERIRKRFRKVLFGSEAEPSLRRSGEWMSMLQARGFRLSGNVRGVDWMPGIERLGTELCGSLVFAVARE